jgi:VanZ family protein
LIIAASPRDHSRMKTAALIVRSAYPLCLIAVIALSLMPQPPRLGIDFEYLDKAEHALAYAALGFLGLGFFGGIERARKNAFLASTSLGLAVGVAIEFVQPYVGRDFEVADMAVDLAGLLLGALAFVAIRRLGAGRRGGSV